MAAFTAQALDITIEGQVQPATLAVAGEIDCVTAPQLQDAVMFALQRGAGSIHLDLAKVTFMDTAGVHVLVAAVRRSRLMGGHLGLTSSSRPVRRLLSLTGVSTSYLQRNCTCELVPASTS